MQFMVGIDKKSKVCYAGISVHNRISRGVKNEKEIRHEQCNEIVVSIPEASERHG
jgi:hypothetical protein